MKFVIFATGKRESTRVNDVESGEGERHSAILGRAKRAKGLFLQHEGHRKARRCSFAALFASASESELSYRRDEGRVMGYLDLAVYVVNAAGCCSAELMDDTFALSKRWGTCTIGCIG